MKQLIVSTIVFLSTLSSAYAIPQKETKQVFKIAKTNVSCGLLRYTKSNTNSVPDRSNEMGFGVGLKRIGSN